MIEKFITDPVDMTELAEDLRRAIQLDPVADQSSDLDLDPDSSPEGRIMQRFQIIRERDPRLRARKIKVVRRACGYVRCEVCGFDFEDTYGSRGRDYIECHHRTPLSESGPTMTAAEDLALLCSNCHRMIHRHRPWLSVDQLMELVTSGH